MNLLEAFNKLYEDRKRLIDRSKKVIFDPITGVPFTNVISVNRRLRHLSNQIKLA